MAPGLIPLALRQRSVLRQPPWLDLAACDRLANGAARLIVVATVVKTAVSRCGRDFRKPLGKRLNGGPIERKIAHPGGVNQSTFAIGKTIQRAGPSGVPAFAVEGRHRAD